MTSPTPHDTSRAGGIPRAIVIRRSFLQPRDTTMRRTFAPAVTAGAIMIVFAATTAVAQDAAKAVVGGGISVPGWKGQIDASEAGRGGKLEDAKLAKEGNSLHVTTGPAVAYWNPANKASGNYTVKATFNEAKYMGLNDH